MCLIYPTFPGTGVLSKYAGGTKGSRKIRLCRNFLGRGAAADKNDCLHSKQS